MKEHILVVDDEAPIRSLLAVYLTRRGYSVATAASAAEAQRAATEAHPDLVILDNGLGDAEGLEVVSAFRRKDPFLPIIMLSGMGCDETLMQEARSRGASAWVSKTAPLENLFEELRRLLQRAAASCTA